MSTPSANYFKRCRSCLGAGCVHCNNQGQIRERVFRALDKEAIRLRVLILSDTGIANNSEGRRREEALNLRRAVLS